MGRSRDLGAPYCKLRFGWIRIFLGGFDVVKGGFRI